MIRWRRICFPQHDFVVCTTTFIATRPFGIRYKAGPFGRSIRDIINSFLFSSFTHTHTQHSTPQPHSLTDFDLAYSSFSLRHPLLCPRIQSRTTSSTFNLNRPTQHTHYAFHFDLHRPCCRRLYRSSRCHWRQSTCCGIQYSDDSQNHARIWSSSHCRGYCLCYAPPYYSGSYSGWDHG